MTLSHKNNFQESNFITFNNKNTLMISKRQFYDKMIKIEVKD